MKATKLVCVLFSFLITLTLNNSAQAGQCEIYVDRAQPVYGSHAARMMVLWYKLDKSVIGQGVASVEVKSRMLSTDKSERFCREKPEDWGCKELAAGWTSKAATPFPNSSDYFEARFFIGGDYYFTRAYEVYFVATLKDGRQIRTFGESSENFIVDQQMVDNMTKVIRSTPYGIDQSRALVVRDGFPYLNPNLCPK